MPYTTPRLVSPSRPQDAYDNWYVDNGCNIAPKTYDITVASYDATPCIYGTFRNLIQFVSVDDVATASHHAWPTFANSGHETTNGMVGFWDRQ